jgi:hypothetical protein
MKALGFALAFLGLIGMTSVAAVAGPRAELVTLDGPGL